MANTLRFFKPVTVRNEMQIAHYSWVLCRSNQWRGTTNPVNQEHPTINLCNSAHKQLIIKDYSKSYLADQL